MRKSKRSFIPANDYSVNPPEVSIAGDGPAGLSVSFHAVQPTAVCGWVSSIWLAASSPTVPGVRWCASVLGGSAWKGTGDGHCCQHATGRGHYVVQSSDTVAVRHVVAPHVIRDDGLRHGTDGVSSR